jgi:hypothetical protein
MPTMAGDDEEDDAVERRGTEVTLVETRSGR